MSSIVSSHSGFPLTVRATDSFTLQAPRGGGRPNRIGDGSVSNPTIDNWLDFNAFTLPAQGTFGNSGIGIINAPSYTNWDFSLGRSLTSRNRSILISARSSLTSLIILISHHRM
ncbi:MAG: hypothetical protein WKF84_18470 [Pyrinomonadaceae bacterium]